MIRFTFLPLALLNQFSNGFNLFFLFNAIIMSIPTISNFTPLAASSPIILVVCIGLIRVGMEDIRKHQYDREANNSISITFKKDKFEKSKWARIQVGEVIKVMKNEVLAVDILITKSSSENGFCYLETTNLDGENTLKAREALAIPQKEIQNECDIGSILANTYIEVDKPSIDIYNVEGTAFINGKEQEKTYFNINNILLRGGRLKNVEYVYGIVLYTGKDTKLMKNINHSSNKVSSMIRKLNIIILIIAVVAVLMCGICTILGGSYRQRYLPDYKNGDLNADYLYYFRGGEPGDTALEIMRIFTGNFSIFSTFIPISIIIVLACVNSIQTINLEFWQPDLRENEGDKVKCFSLSLQEEMGMVKYIFTDKTGTLTRNEMEFKACSIFNLLFEDEEHDKMPENLTEFKTQFTLSTLTNSNTTSKFSKSFNKHFIFENLLKDIPIMLNSQTECPFKSFKYAIRELLFNLSLNHNVLTEYDNEKKVSSFQGANPDEVTLVGAASELGFRFEERNTNIIKLSINLQEQEIKTFEVLQMFEFTSSRQRSSIILKDLDTNEIKLYLKGSDKKIFESINDFSKENILPQTKEHADSFARRGLRTLCYAFKNIDPDTYEEWKKSYEDLKYNCINDKTLYPQLEESISLIESNAILLGVSALEDKLQDGVKEDLKSFIEAGINVWMITGDKMDTAESIGHSCKLFSDDTEVFKIRDTSKVDEAIKRMKEINEEMNVMDSELKHLAITEGRKENDEIITLKDHKEDNDLVVKIQKNYLETEQNIFSKEIIDDIDIDNINSKNKLNPHTEKDNIKQGHETIHDGSILKYMVERKYIANSNENFNDLSLQEKISQENDKNKDVQSHNEHLSKKKDIINHPIPVNHGHFVELFNKCKTELDKNQKLQERNNLKNRLNFWSEIKNDNTVFDLKMNFGIIIEGQAISQCIASKEAEELFWQLIKKSRSLICCRCSPIQKGQVVNFIKRKSNQTTLAIGDGGNDVNMIKSANIGIGLFGKEGCQAAYNSDYAISQFKYLKRLLFYTGHYSLERNSYFLYFYFFKNIFYTFPQFCFSFLNGFSGANLYDEWYYMGYNSWLTVFPISSRAMCEEDFDPEFKNYPARTELLQSLVPDIYSEYRDSIPFSYLRFFTVFAAAIIFSIPPYFTPLYDFRYGIKSSSGTTYTYWDISISSFFSLVIIHFFIIINDTSFYNWVVVMFQGGQFIINILFFIIYELCKYDKGVSGYLFDILNNWHFWLNIIIASAICIVPFYIYRRFEFFFGNLIVNKIKISKCNEQNAEKFYKKKITMMTKAIRSVAKFKKIYKLNKEEDYDNLVDQQMKKIVDEFKENKRTKNNKKYQMKH